MKLKAVLTAAMLLAPTAALAAPGIVTVSTGLRAGPGSGFPLVDHIPGGSRVNVYGCLKANAWCDVGWSDDRGWVSSQYLEYLYRDKYVYLPDFVDAIDVPVVPFVLSSYWSSYYSGRPWYQRRAYWNNYWTTHERVGTEMTIDQSAARIGREASRDAAIAEGRAGRPSAVERATRERDAAQNRSAREAQGHAAAAHFRMAHEQARMVHENDDASARARVRPPMARLHEAPRIFAAPAARYAMPHGAQPNVSHGSPMNAQAQMSTSRAAPPIPHNGGGGPAGGGVRGHERQ